MSHNEQKNIRSANVQRRTSETDIQVEVNLDGSGQHSVDTGVVFLDHMLASFSKHSEIDLVVTCKGDTDVDDHHSVEDIALVIGSAILKALGDKRGIQRYGWSMIPMDEALARCALDLGGRSYSVFKCRFSRPDINGFSTELVEHFFLSLSRTLQANIHLRVIEEGNSHHMIEALFKAFAYAFKQAVAITGSTIPSTKGTL